MTDGKPKLVVFSDDWGRHPSSCQHLVSHLLTRLDVTWVNTIGMRPPRWDGATLRRGVEKLRHWGTKEKSARPQDDRPAPRVLNPLMLPSFSGGWSRALNRSLLARHLERHIHELASGTVLTTIPVVADLVGAIPAARWVYYCVDDFAEWPGLDGRTLRTMEDVLIERVDAIVAAGPNLAEGVARRGRTATIVTHGVDLEHWRVAGSVVALPALAGLARPLVLFWGLVDRRLDVDWLRRLAQEMESGTIVLVGPQQDPDPALDEIARIHRTGPLSYDSLPRAAAAADVLVMPYADLPVTRAMQPLKLKEYLATGKPVVVRRLPATEAWDDCLLAADTPERFVEHVKSCLREGLTPAQQAARQRLADESWASKAMQLEEVLCPAADLSGAIR